MPSRPTVPRRAPRRRRRAPRRRGRRPAAVAAAIAAAAGAALGWLALAGSDRSDDRLRSDRPDAPPPDALRAGAELYAVHCASCHGVDLEGEPGWQAPRPDGTWPAPPHDGSGHTWHHPDEQLFAITREGGQASAPPGFRSGMPAFGDRLSDDQIRAVLAFIESHWSAEQRAFQERVSRGRRGEGGGLGP